ncbi:MAG: GIY-YIG nuclease family protein [Thermodesulfovibrionia bacterium]|nr:GIY-YIG nuclease family protein [Thermodesulfovibrionia bacterium]
MLKLKVVGDKEYYIGYAEDLRVRFEQHLKGMVRTTKGRSPRLIYYEAFNNKYLALQREKGLKTSGSVYMALMKRLRIK